MSGKLPHESRRALALLTSARSDRVAKALWTGRGRVQNRSLGRRPRSSASASDLARPPAHFRRGLRGQRARPQRDPRTVAGHQWPGTSGRAPVAGHQWTSARAPVPGHRTRAAAACGISTPGPSDRTRAAAACGISTPGSSDRTRAAAVSTLRRRHAGATESSTETPVATNLGDGCHVALGATWHRATPLNWRIRRGRRQNLCRPLLH